MKPIQEKSAKELAAMPDKDIDYSDIPELTADFWKNAQLLRPARKKMLTLRVDEDVITWFKKEQGRGYQAYMNAVLRAFAQARQP